MKNLFVSVVSMLMLLPFSVYAASEGFIISSNGRSAPIIVADSDWRGVIRAAGDLAGDIGKVTGTAAEVHAVSSDRGFKARRKGGAIIAGTIGKSPIIDRLIKKGLLDVDSVRGQWESFVIDNVGDNLVIAGSDKRGTIYGIYEVSRLIGVSPWHYWADVPARRSDTAVYSRGRYVQPSPKVRYRGIFINDEWPSFGGWCVNRFGGVNSKAYAHVFELLLRLKANYLWPAMWDTAFNEDDEECPRLADEYGIVMGTSHHEPMMRAHKEYTRRRDSIGPWDYASNAGRIGSFFRYGMERNSGYDNLVTIGMRGDGDVAMGRGDDEDNMATLRDVIRAQRDIISDVYGRPDSVPQLWAIFTEVQRYYDAGFTVPDDVTLLFCDNNWGYIRRTAPADERSRSGGFGMYYHIDMNGGPWNDRWVNTSPLPKLREQLNLAYRSGIDRIWIINVGDLKPKELPIDFIMDYAWNPDKVRPGDEKTWLTRWAEEIFGKGVAGDVADILARYPKYNLWRKPEVQTAGIFSVENYDEASRVDSLWEDLTIRTERLRDRIAPEARDAFYQLVYYPAMASAGVARMYIAADKNRYYAGLDDPRANLYADRVKALFERDSLMTVFYNDSLSNGKWRGMMQDKHIGYTQWFMPDRNIMPAVTYVTAGKACVEPVRKATTEYSVSAIRYSRKTGAGGVNWIVLPDLGREDGCMGIDNVSAASASVAAPGPVLEYDIDTSGGDSVRVAIGILPTQDINPARGLRLGVRLDDGETVVLDARRGLVDTFSEYTRENLKRSKKLKPLPAAGRMSLNGCGRNMRNEIFDNMRWLDVSFPAGKGVRHTLKLVMIDPEIVVEKLVINPDDSCYSYFGPPER